MARTPRIHVPGRIHHVTTRGNGGQSIVTAARDWDNLRDLIATVKLTAGFRLYAYCFMSNHIHLLLQVGDVPLSKIMQRIESSWARRINIKEDRSGHLFQGRFKSRDCDGDAYFKWLLRYIHFNPVEAGMAARPEDWRWSSYREYVEPSGWRLADVEWPLSLFSPNRHAAVQAFREFVLQQREDRTEPLPMEDSRVPTEAITRPLGSGSLRPPLPEIADEVARQTKLEACVLWGTSRERRVCAARRLFVARAVVRGYAISEVARALALSPMAVSLMLRQADRSVLVG